MRASAPGNRLCVCDGLFRSYAVAVATAERRAVLWGVFSYGITSCAVLLGMAAGVRAPPCDGYRRTFVESFAQLDAISHIEIANWGYIREAYEPPCTARFPMYPLVVRSVKQISGFRANVAAVLVAHGCFLGACAFMARYLSWRWPHEPPSLPTFALLTMGLWPWTLFLRLPYTESLFLLAALTAMYGMQRRWPSVVVALVVGFATGVRPVGIALLGAFAVYLWQLSRGWRRFMFKSVTLLPLACWGLVAFMVYLEIYFDDPFCFATAHAHWVHRPTAWSQKWCALLTLEPLWSPYVPSSYTYWGAWEPHDSALFNYAFMNPLVFVASVALISVGIAKRWLNAREAVLSGLLLLVPYVTMAYDNLMISQPRFACVIFPVYIVMARLLQQLPRIFAAAIILGCAALLVAYAALFAAGYGTRYRILW